MWQSIAAQFQVSITLSSQIQLDVFKRARILGTFLKIAQVLGTGPNFSSLELVLTPRV